MTMIGQLQGHGFGSDPPELFLQGQAGERRQFVGHGAVGVIDVGPLQRPADPQRGPRGMDLVGVDQIRREPPAPLAGANGTLRRRSGPRLSRRETTSTPSAGPGQLFADMEKIDPLEGQMLAEKRGPRRCSRKGFRISARENMETPHDGPHLSRILRDCRIPPGAQNGPCRIHGTERRRP